jgi:serine/threonine protein kinase/tetratricopeptide (TPR) repeat protein
MSTARAKEIFLDAIELPIEQQQHYVQQACAGDEELRAQIEKLLQSHQSHPGLLDGPAAGLGPDWIHPQAAADAPRAERAGDVIDRYQLIRQIGEGGFGTVFLAQQIEPVQREVALKVIRLGMDTQQIIARFKMERQALAMMDHPGIARVLDAGSTASGRPYFVMEYVAGVPINGYCEHHKLNTSQRLELIEQACLAVQHAHQKGIIHRDLKPGNILVTRVDDRAIPKIIDFGVAKAIDPGFATTPSLLGAPAVTMEAQIIGTPQYMSPEQVAGSAGRIDTRSDVYSLGMILYELITGTAAFDLSVLRSASLEEVARLIREQTPVKPSKRISELRPPALASRSASAERSRHVVDEIDWIVMKALEKEPSRRYQSPSELAGDIHRHLSDQPVLASPPSRLYLLRKFTRRHRASIATAAVVVVALVAMTVTSTLLATWARRAENQARQQARRAEEELARSNAIVGFTGDLLAGIGPSVARGRDTTLLHEILDISIQKAANNLAGQPSVELAVRNLIANALYDLGDSQAALAQLRGIYDSTRDSPLGDHPERLRAAVLMAQMLVERNELTEADKLVNDALAGYQRTQSQESDDAYKARLAQAAVDLFSGRAPIAEQRFAAVLAHFRAIGRGESQPAIHAWNNLALSVSGQDRWAEACELWQQLNAVDRRLYGDTHPYTLMTLMDVGTSLTHLNRLDEAGQVLHETLAMARKLFPPGHPTLLVNMNNLGGLLLQTGKLDEADAILTEALETGQKKLAPLDQPMDAIVLQLGQLRARQGRFDEAVKYAHDLHSAVASKFGERNVKTLSALVLVYDNLLAAGRAAEGVSIVEKIGDLPPEVPPDLRQRLHACAGRLYLAAGNEAAARQQAKLARQAVQKDSQGNQRVTGSLRLLETQLHITQTSTTSVSH